MVSKVRIERTSPGLQPGAKTTSATWTFMVGKCGYAPPPVKDEFYRLAAETIRFTSPYMLLLAGNDPAEEVSKLLMA